ncbi:MAG: thioredoxin domain-containing protein [Alphaproteobacteria bacterium]
MASVLKAFLLAVFVLAASSVAQAADDRMGDRVLGNPNAPIKVEEFVSLTCSHCAEFYNTVLPELEKRYVDTGKVKFIMRDFALNGIDLKAFAVARCMPADEFYPFVKTLYANQVSWAFSGGDPIAKMIQYAKLGGLSEDKAKACAADTKLQDALVAERTDAGTKYKIEATPTFIINDGMETVNGVEKADAFAATFDALLAAKK